MKTWFIVKFELILEIQNKYLMSKGIRIRRGANLNLYGEANKILNKNISAKSFALRPTDFFSFNPKLAVKEGEQVAVGSPIFFSKDDPRIKVVAPVAGTVVSIVRGAKRKILKVVIEPAGDEVVQHNIGNPSKLNADGLKKLLLDSGCWPFIEQRPYGIIANPDDTPKAIFISALNTGPLQADFDFILKDSFEALQLGINVLSRIVGNNIYLGIDKLFSGAFKDLKNINTFEVSGAHPAGNVGVQIHHFSPINMGEKVWTIRPEDIVNIGMFFKTGIFHAKRTFAIAGSAVESPKYFEAKIGVELSPYMDDAKIDKSQQVRVINGDVLSGTAEASNGYLGYFNNLVTIIPEGKEYRMFGWLPFKDNHILSLSKTSLSWLFKKKKYAVNTNINGEERALVVTGEMEKVFPMDIFPMSLLKACMIGDIEQMEALGIYEVVPEDFGLIDYSNTSKIEAQEIIRKGIELMIKEVG